MTSANLALSSRRLEFHSLAPALAHEILNRQWLIANGLGGYASGTIGGAINWKYHGLLVAALPAPFGRVVMLNHLRETLYFPEGSEHVFGGQDVLGTVESTPSRFLTEFWLEDHLPCWRYEIHGAVLEKRVLMPNRQNTVHVQYQLRSSSAGAIRLELRPSVHFRPFEQPVSRPLGGLYEVRVRGRRFEIDSGAGFPPLRLQLDTSQYQFVHDTGAEREIYYERDAARGYESRGVLWTPGYFSLELRERESATLIASTEDWHVLEALNPRDAYEIEKARASRLNAMADPAVRTGLGRELVLAADQFIITPTGRVRDMARARAAGHELRSVIAGYHWFTDWGRDTMISLEGLTLITGRTDEAGWILRTFANAVRHGLIPNMFPEGRSEGVYHTADATLWFFQAIHRYVLRTRDESLLADLLPTLRDIVEHHLAGTHYGIGVDAQDGLLRQGQEGYQLTWMDAKVGDWVVTPRRGKAVEINALWFNALQLLASWLRAAGDQQEAERCETWAKRARVSFNERFWNAATGGLFDVVDGESGDDAAVRPNQLFAVSLTHPILEASRWASVVQLCQRELLTPVGLRSLSPRDRQYQAKYTGDLRARDAAYHQGTVWAWLIGPFIDAWLKVHPGRTAEAREFLRGFEEHLSDGCIGSISEIFDAEAPFTERGCIAQAWSVAEVLRCLALTGAGLPDQRTKESPARHTS